MGGRKGEPSRRASRFQRTGTGGNVNISSESTSKEFSLPAHRTPTPKVWLLQIPPNGAKSKRKQKQCSNCR
jgi:hypothetical protein